MNRKPTIRTIWVPGAERYVSLRTYLAGYRLAKANPDAMFKHGITTWWATTGRDIVRQFVTGMHERINDEIPYIERK